MWVTVFNDHSNLKLIFLGIFTMTLLCGMHLQILPFFLCGKIDRGFGFRGGGVHRLIGDLQPEGCLQLHFFQYIMISDI